MKNLFSKETANPVQSRPGSLTLFRSFQWFCADKISLLLLLTLLFTANTSARSLLPSTVLSASGKNTVKLEPIERPIPVGSLHQWRLIIIDRKTGDPAQISQIAFDGGMPAHGHGLPTIPQAATYEAESGWLIEGVKFNMSGLWELKVRFQTPDLWDTATIKVAVGDRVIRSAEASTDHWSVAEIAVLKSLRLEEPENNQLATSGNVEKLSQNTDARAIGKKLFFDSQLSKNNSISCSTCHQPDRNFTDGLSTSIGLEPLTRNAPTLVGSGAQRWFYWDGRRDSLWSQALVPMEAPAEMGNTRTRIAQYITQDYLGEYETIFGSTPPLPKGLPMEATPAGTAVQKTAWQSLPLNIRERINRIFSNTGKLIAAWEASLTHQPTRFDLFVDLLSEGNTSGAHEILNENERAGLKLFINNKTQCMNCHNSPLFTNHGFHNIGTGMSKNGDMDFGRMIGSQMVLMDEFNCGSQYSDSQSNACRELKYSNENGHGSNTRGAFKVPTLRGLSRTAPFMHDGRFDSLEEVMDFYINPPAATNTMRHELPTLNHLTEEDKKNLIAFLNTL